MTVSPVNVEFNGTGQQQTISAFPVDRRGNPVEVVVTFTSSNPTVVSLSGQANRSVVVTGVAAGTATITATTPGRTAPLTSQVPVTVRCRIQLGTPVPGSINDLFVGQQRTIQVTVTADPGCSNAVNWSSSATGVASVDQTGRVTGVGAGTATITIRSQQDQAISVSVPVTVLSVVSVDIPSASDEVQVAASKTITAVTNPAGVPIEWATSNPNVASITQAGVVTGVADGTVTITATAIPDRTKSDQMTLRVRGRVLNIIVNPTSANLTVPQQVTITPVLTVDPGVSTAVTWSTSNPQVASVNGSGVVTAVGKGTATITATSVADPTKSAGATINVEGRVISVSVTPQGPSIQTNATVQLSATVVADPGVDTGVDWTSSNPNVASVHPTSGLVTGVSNGQAVITARSRADATKAGSTTVSVSNTTIVINERTPVVSVAATTQLTATVTPPGPVTWESANEAIATVSASGLVTGVSVGTATIRAKLVANPAVQDQVTVTVTSVCTPSINITPNPVNNLGPGSSQQLTATVSPQNCQGPVTWESSNPAVASVSGTGLVTAGARGTATITAKLASNPAIQASVTVTVVDVISVAVAPTSDSVRVGRQKQLTATVNADPGVPLTVTWSSSNPGIASVSATGLVTGVSVGTVTITARSAFNPGKFAAATIKVGSACDIPLIIANGQTVNGTVNAQSCNGFREIWGFTTGPAAYEITGNASFTYDFAPLVSSSGWWFWGAQTGAQLRYVIVGTGTYRSHIDALGGATGTASLTMGTWAFQTACPYSVIGTNITIPGFPLSNLCPTNYQPAGTVGTFYSRQADLLPQLGAGQQLTVTVNASGFEPRVDLLNGSNAVVASAVAAAGVFSVQLSYTPGAATFVRLRVSSRNALATGTITTLTIVGPSASLMVRDANAFVAGAAAGPSAPGGGCSGAACRPVQPPAWVNTAPARSPGVIRDVAPSGRRQ
jgi:uncharacterized protein YjdB